MDKCIAPIEYRKNNHCVSLIGLILFFWLKNIQMLTKEKAGADLAGQKVGKPQRQLSEIENVQESAFRSAIAEAHPAVVSGSLRAV